MLMKASPRPKAVGSAALTAFGPICAISFAAFSLQLLPPARKTRSPVMRTPITIPGMRTRKEDVAFRGTSTLWVNMTPKRKRMRIPPI